MITVIHDPTGKRIPTYEPGRVCSTCPTVLSIFNPRHRCAQCDPLPQILGKREHHDAMDALIDFMEQP